MADYPGFDQDKIEAALEAAQRHNSSVGLNKSSAEMDIRAGGEMAISGGCISVTVKDGKVCLNLPLGIGSYCLPVPSWVPEGAEVRACIDICTTWGIPTGVKITVSFNDTVIFTKSFLKC